MGVGEGGLQQVWGTGKPTSAGGSGTHDPAVRPEEVRGVETGRENRWTPESPRARVGRK